MAEPRQPLWCPTCGGRDSTPVPGGAWGFSRIEVTCDMCGTPYSFAVNLGAWFARAEQERRESAVSSSE